jgi:hypothetical protein
MLKWYCRFCVAMVCLAMAGCTLQAPTITPADAAAQVQTGRALLACRDACLAEWRRLQPQAAQLETAGRWPELAATVLQANYEDDLSLYYLGRAAEGLGYPGAAASYYRQSLRLSATGASCQYLSRNCGGLALVRATETRLAAIERRLAPSRRRASPGPGRPAAAEPAGEAASPGPAGTAPPWEPVATPVVAASPPASAQPESAPPPAPARTPASSDFIEPPPAR